MFLVVVVVGVVVVAVIVVVVCCSMFEVAGVIVDTDAAASGLRDIDCLLSVNCIALATQPSPFGGTVAPSPGQ